MLAFLKSTRELTESRKTVEISWRPCKPSVMKYKTYGGAKGWLSLQTLGGNSSVSKRFLTSCNLKIQIILDTLL